jgi:hypothetical protein
MPNTRHDGSSKVMMRCSTCHGEDVLRDAWACWSVERQEWELGQVFDHAFCETCDSECTIESAPAEIA